MKMQALRHLAALLIVVAGCDASSNSGGHAGVGGASLATPTAFCMEWEKVASETIATPSARSRLHASAHKPGDTGCGTS